MGTRAFIVLLQGRDQQDPLFLQVKEATTSVLEDHLPKSRFKQPGERVVQGQRMMQAASDIYLGWTKGVEANRFLYWRQLRDMKGSVVIESMPAANLEFYAGLCGWTLARAHARSGRPGRDRRLPREERRVRSGAHGLLRALRRPERRRTSRRSSTRSAPAGWRRSKASERDIEVWTRRTIDQGRCVDE